MGLCLIAAFLAAACWGPPASDGWSEQSISVASSARGIAVVDDIRAARHEGFDRFVVEFEDDILPGYAVEYSDAPAECGSGEPVTLEGTGVIEIRTEPARGYTEEGRSTVDHRRRSFDLPVIRELDVGCDFEAVFTVFLGVTARSGFRASTLQNPARLVVDIRHRTS